MNKLKQSKCCYILKYAVLVKICTAFAIVDLRDDSEW